VSASRQAKPVNPADQKKKAQTTTSGLKQTLRHANQRAASREATARAAARAAAREAARKAALQAALAEVDALRLQLQETQRQLREAQCLVRHTQRLANLGMLAAMVAHEFNNILTPVINYAQQAMKHPRHVEKALRHAHDGGQRAADICNTLLGLTRPSDKAEENLLGLVDDTLTAMGRDFGKDGIDLVRDIPADLSLRTRRVELQQVLVNLLLNARDALLSRRGGEQRIRLTARPGGGTVMLSVSDSGPGVPGELHDRVFEPLFSTKSPDDETTTGGHGLGLPFCRNIVAALGGTITLHSPPGHGATFTLALPDE